MPRRPLSFPASPVTSAVTQARWAVSIVGVRCARCAGGIDVGVRHRLVRRREPGDLMPRTWAVCEGCVEGCRDSAVTNADTA